MDSPKRIAIDSAIILAVLTAYLYGVSTAYTGGYLGQLDLDADVLDRNFNQTLFHGFLLCLPLAMSSMAFVAIVSWLYSHNLLPAINDWLRRSARNKRKYVKAHRSIVGRRRDSRLEQREKRRTLHAIAYLVVAVLVLTSLVHFESLGKEAANTIRKALVDGSYRSKALWHVKVDTEIRKLVPLGCGARNCAGIETSTQLVYYFPQNGHAYEVRALVPVAPLPAQAPSSGAQAGQDMTK